MRRGCRYVLAVGAVAAIATALWLGWPRPRLLMERAARIRVPGGRLSTNTYFWLSDRELLALTDQFGILRLDTRTGWSVRRALPDPAFAGSLIEYEMLDAFGKGRTASPYRITIPCALAADRTHILWQSLGGPDERFSVRATDLTGSVLAKARGVPESSEGTLLPAGGGWIGFWADGQSKLRTQMFRLDGSSASPDFILPGVNALVQPLGITRGGTLLVLDANAGGPRSVELVEIALPPAPRVVRRQTVRFEGEVVSVTAALSPDGRCVAWLASLHVPAPDPPALRPLYARLGLRDRTLDEVCVSRTDGRDLRAVGRLERAGAQSEPDVTDLEWLPGGTRVSFLRDRALYTVAAD